MAQILSRVQIQWLGEHVGLGIWCCFGTQLARWHGSLSLLIQNWCWNCSYADGTMTFCNIWIYRYSFSRWQLHRRCPTLLWAMQPMQDRDLKKMLRRQVQALRLEFFSRKPTKSSHNVRGWQTCKKCFHRCTPSSPKSYDSIWHYAVYNGFACASGQWSQSRLQCFVYLASWKCSDPRYVWFVLHYVCGAAILHLAYCRKLQPWFMRP